MSTSLFLTLPADPVPAATWQIMLSYRIKDSGARELGGDGW